MYSWSVRDGTKNIQDKEYIMRSTKRNDNRSCSSTREVVFTLRLTMNTICLCPPTRVLTSSRIIISPGSSSSSQVNGTDARQETSRMRKKELTCMQSKKSALQRKGLLEKERMIPKDFLETGHRE